MPTLDPVIRAVGHYPKGCQPGSLWMKLRGRAPNPASPEKEDHCGAGISRFPPLRPENLDS